jgi:hypothetical protein
MKCGGCGHEHRDAAKFCEECAAPLGRKCTRCGANLRSVAKYCDECAAPVTGASPSRSADPRSYTPKHLAEKILTSRSALEGERKQVTVLFADVKGSMDLAEQVDPEEWHKIMDRFFAILSDGVHRFEGTINQFTGDGIMALFGAPIAHEDHAQRACYAALHLQQELRSYADELRLKLDMVSYAESCTVYLGQLGGNVLRPLDHARNASELARRRRTLLRASSRTGRSGPLTHSPKIGPRPSRRSRTGSRWREKCAPFGI